MCFHSPNGEINNRNMQLLICLFTVTAMQLICLCTKLTLRFLGWSVRCTTRWLRWLGCRKYWWQIAWIYKSMTLKEPKHRDVICNSRLVHKCILLIHNDLYNLRVLYYASEWFLTLIFMAHTNGFYYYILHRALHIMMRPAITICHWLIDHESTSVKPQAV